VNRLRGGSMRRCKLCYPFTHNKADYAVIFGNEERQLFVCKWCLEDLTLLGFNAHQIIGLPEAKA
jgi:hypothetical protein